MYLGVIHGAFLEIIQERYPLLDPLPLYSTFLVRALDGEEGVLEGYQKEIRHTDDDLYRAEDSVYLTQLLDSAGFFYAETRECLK